MRSVLALASLLFGSSAFAATVDFEDAINITDNVIESGGFRFESDSYGMFLGQTLYGLGNGGLGFGSQSGVLITMSSIDGSNFALSSLEIGEIFFGYSVNTLVTGYMDGGGTVDLLVEDLRPPEVRSVLFDSSWNNLVAVDFRAVPIENGIIVIDNIVVSSVVPIPAAVWLFGSALAGLGWMRRRKTA